MKVLRLKLFQETACYKKPAASKVGETYPLPPFATVKGMFHQILGAESYIPMQICVQGSYESRIVDYQKHYFYKKININQFPLITDGLAVNVELTEITSMPIYIHMLYHVNLVIHVKAEDDVMVQLKNNIEQGAAFSLGRWEDLVRVDECQIVETRLAEEDEAETKLPIYVPLSFSKDVVGVPYRLNWKYEIVKGVRQWQRIKVRYVQSGEGLYDEGCKVDPEGYPVIFAKEMEE